MTFSDLERYEKGSARQCPSFVSTEFQQHLTTTYTFQQYSRFSFNKMLKKC